MTGALSSSVCDGYAVLQLLDNIFHMHAVVLRVQILVLSSPRNASRTKLCGDSIHLADFGARHS